MSKVQLISIDAILTLTAYLKSKGIDTTNHPIMKDLARVKSYMNRAKESLNPTKGKFNFAKCC